MRYARVWGKGGEQVSAPPSIDFFFLHSCIKDLHCLHAEMGGPSRGRPARTKSAPAAPTLTDSSTSSLFFALQRGRIYHPVQITKVVSVTIPSQHLGTRGALGDVVLRRFLHKMYDMSSERSGVCPNDDVALATSNSSPEDPYVIVCVDAVEPHPDTSHQANPQGDVRLNVMVTFTVARVRYGILTGAASEDGALSQCVRVSVPSSDPVDAAPTAILVARREDEPSINGQAVFLVSEPGSIRYVAVRPPRHAPRPFKMTRADGTVEVRVDCDDDAPPPAKKGRQQHREAVQVDA